MKSLLTLSNKVAASLTSVKCDPSPVKAGDFFALKGAWDRKKVVVHVTNNHNKEVVRLWCRHCRGVHDVEVVLKQRVQLQNVGRIYSDGRWVKPTRVSDTIFVDIFYYAKDGVLVANAPMYSGYVKVQPVGKKKVKVVTNKSVDPKTGRFDSDGSYKGPWLTM